MVLVSLRMFRLKRSIAGDFAVPFRVYSRNNTTRDNVLFSKRYLLGVKKTSKSRPQNRTLVPVRGSLRNFPVPFIWGSPRCRLGAFLCENINKPV